MRRFTLPTLIIHWAFVLFSGLSILSGFSIANDHRNWQTPALFDSLLISNHVFVWHTIAAIGLVVSLVLYISYIFVTNQTASVWPKRFQFKNTFQPGNKHPLSAFTNLLGLILLVCLSTTGVLNLLEQSFSTGWIRDSHWIAALGLLLFFFIHPAQKLITWGYRILASLFQIKRTPTLKQFGLIFLAAVTCLVITQYQGLLIQKHILVMAAERAPIIDGNDSDPAWATPSTSIITKLGNTPEYNTEVNIKSVIQGDMIYFLLQWKDENKSLSHVPLLKTQQHWQPVEDGFSQDNEQTFYEDKLAIMIGKHPLDAMRSIHLGANPIKGAPTPRHGRGYHYFHNENLVDVWQWKAWRTNSLFQADDNYFTQPLPPKTCDKRYTAGYEHDPSQGGGYKPNWQEYDTQQITPKRLPKGDRFILPFNQQDEISGQLRAGMRWADTFVFEPHLDRIPANHVMPSFLTKGPLQGDRASVKARGTWKDGVWTLELARLIDTGSPYDVAFSDTTYIWVALFNHAQTRHSYHLRPLALQLHTNRGNAQ